MLLSPLLPPVLAIDEMLHCLLGSGLSLHVANAVGEGIRKKADRMVRAIMVAVLIGYILVFITNVPSIVIRVV